MPFVVPEGGPDMQNRLSDSQGCVDTCVSVIPALQRAAQEIRSDCWKERHSESERHDELGIRRNRIQINDERAPEETHADKGGKRKREPLTVESAESDRNQATGREEHPKRRNSAKSPNLWLGGSELY
jgi:hypothetical protein